MIALRLEAAGVIASAVKPGKIATRYWATLTATRQVGDMTMVRQSSMLFPEDVLIAQVRRTTSLSICFGKNIVGKNLVV